MVSGRRSAPVSQRLRERFGGIPLWQRVLALLTVIPFIVGGGASAAFYFNLHRTSKTMTLAGLPELTAPKSGRRILVLSPHCDDETLGAGAMIADACRSGAEVTVAFLTNGDGFPFAARRTLKEIRLSPADYIRFAEKRQRESVAALQELGVDPARIKFMGYPDRGLSALWETHWDSAAPYRSRYTGHTRSPYSDVYTPKAPYCGTSLLADLERLYAETQPTEIYVTHPADDHSDHTAAATFAQAALLHAQDRGAHWTRTVRLRYYLVHRGDWPLPQGNHPDEPLIPPAGLSTLDTQWEVYPVSEPTREAKRRALNRYRSQMAVMSRFLVSFVRQNEIFGTLPAPGSAGETPPGTADGFSSCPDAAADNVVRYAGPSADLRSVTVYQTPRSVHIRLTTRGPISPRVRYSVLLRATGNGSDQATRYITLKLPRQADGETAEGVTASIDGNRLEWRVPLNALVVSNEAPRRIWIAATTSWARLPVDQTGFRPFDLAKLSVKERPLLSENRNGGDAVGG